MKALRNFLILMLATTILSSCTKHKIEGSGNIVAQERALDDFENVVIKSVIKTNVTYGTDFSVVVRTDAVAINKVHTHVSNNSLIIDLDEHYNYHHISFEVDVVMPSITRLEHQGVSDSKLTGFYGLGTLDVMHDGVGDLRISGTSSQFNVTHTGVGDLHAFDLSSDSCHADLDGVGNIELSVSELLEGHLTGVGNIYYSGSPTVNVIDTGVGSVIQVN